MANTYDPEQLSEAENRASQNVGTSTSGGEIRYTDETPESQRSLYNSSSTKSGRLRLRNWSGRKKALIGGGIATAGVGGAIAFFTIISGPLQFVHMAQSLQRFHFSASQDTADDRFVRLGRYIYYGKDKPQNTRLNYLSNKWANKIEARLNKSGIQTAYTPTFGLFDGYIIDPKTVPDLKDKSNDGAKKYFKDRYGVTIEDRNGKLFVRADQVGYFKTSRSMIKQMMVEAGYSRISAAVQSRIMGKRAGIDWHPIKKLDNKILRTVDARYAKWRENRTQTIERGVQVATTTESRPINDPGEDETQKQKRSTDATKSAAEADSAISDGQTVREEVSKGNTSAIKGFQDRLSTKIGLGGVSAAGVLCIAKSLDDQQNEIKQVQVILPLMRMGMEIIAVGNQVMSGDDVSAEQLGFYTKLLNEEGPDGIASSWSDARSIQAEFGHPNSGVGADETLTKINKGTPFSFLNEGKFDPVMDSVCSGGGQAVQVIISFFGGPLSALTNLVVGAALGPPIMDAMAHWLAGKAIDPNAEGAKFGNYINYGARLAANDQAIAAGGIEMDPVEAAEIKRIADYSYQEEFRSKPIAYRLFNPYDHQSLVARFIDSQHVDLRDTLENFADIFLSFGSLVAKGSTLFQTKAQAATNYDYGFPTYGYSAQELNSEGVKNPLINSEESVKILSGSDGQKYIELAKKCFGVEIFTDANDRWAVSGGENIPKYSDIREGACRDQSIGWLRIRFFILDTQVMESVACYEGDDEACANVELNSNAIGASGIIPSDSELPSGTVQELAKRILANLNISYPLDASSDNGSTKVVLQTLAAGQPAPVTCTNTSIRSTGINPGILQFLIDLGDQMKIGVNALTDKCHSLGSNHYKGQAVDFECNAVSFDIAKADSIAQKYGGKRNYETCTDDKHWHYDFVNN